ncbi:hypothetical protein EDB86DRAFT_3079641 [Lactarius hatsudake]|nr:hypothetical protein EDB86DRAFT_3079641 [Lactarius hatsudake]
MRTTQRSYNQLVEEEVCRRKAEDKRHVFVFNIIDLVPRESAQASAVVPPP